MTRIVTLICPAHLSRVGFCVLSLGDKNYDENRNQFRNWILNQFKINNQIQN